MIRILCVALFFVLSLNLPTSSHAKSLEKELRKSVKYLEEIPEVKWLKVNRDNVIVGWKGFPSNFNLLNTEAALKGTRATGRKVNVWSVRHTQKKWITGTRPYLCKTTAKNGTVKKTSCNF
jgi:hypothetical protein